MLATFGPHVSPLEMLAEFYLSLPRLMALDPNIFYAESPIVRDMVQKLCQEFLRTLRSKNRNRDLKKMMRHLQKMERGEFEGQAAIKDPTRAKLAIATEIFGKGLAPTELRELAECIGLELPSKKSGDLLDDKDSLKQLARASEESGFPVRMTRDGPKALTAAGTSKTKKILP